MPTYTIDGVRYKSEVPLSDDELEELSSVSAPAPDDWAKEAARLGLAKHPSYIYGAFKGALKGEGQTGARKYVEEAKSSIMDFLGGTGAKPKSVGQRIAASGIEAAFDPANLVMPASSLVAKAPFMAKPALQTVEGFAAGAGAEAGGTVGEIAGEKIGGETGAKVGRIGGALAGGIGGTVATGTIPRTAAAVGPMISPSAEKVKSLFSRFRGTQPEDVVAQQASKHIENVFIAAASSDPNFAKVIEDAVAAQQATGVKLPISAYLADNQVINAHIRQMAAKDPAFRESYFAQFNEAKAALRNKSEKLFGSPSSAAAGIPGVKDVDVAGSVAKRRNLLQAQAQKATARLESVDPFDFGARIVKVTDDAEKSARAATSPRYAEAIDYGKASGVELPPAAVSDIHDFVAGEKSSDIFKNFPSIYNKVKALWGPKKPEFKPVVDANGLPFAGPTEKTFSSAPVEQIDSLKREINAQLRGVRNEDSRRLLMSLKEKLNQHVSELDPDFVSLYRAADAEYLQRVGLPFNEQTIRMINSAKFDENVVPLLTKNKSTLMQFIDATGDQGKALAEDAFVSTLLKKPGVIKDGVLDTGVVNKWLRDNDDALSLVPDIRERIKAVASDVQSLNNKKAAISDKFVRAAQERMLKIEGKTPQELVNELYRSPEFVEKFMQRHLSGKSAVGLEKAGGAPPEALKAVRAFMLDDIISSANPKAILADRNKARVFNRVFGPTYSEKVNQFATVADRMTKDPSSVLVNISAADIKTIESMFGTSPQTMYSLLVTNPVVSKEVAFLTLFNRFFNRQASKRADDEMKRILLDPDLAAQHFRTLTKEGKIDFDKLKDASAAMKKAGFDYLDLLRQDIEAGATRSPVGYDVPPPIEYDEE